MDHSIFGSHPSSRSRESDPIRFVLSESTLQKKSQSSAALQHWDSRRVEFCLLLLYANTHPQTHTPDRCVSDEKEYKECSTNTQECTWILVTGGCSGANVLLSAEMRLTARDTSESTYTYYKYCTCHTDERVLYSAVQKCVPACGAPRILRGTPLNSRYFKDPCDTSKKRKLLEMKTLSDRHGVQ